MKTIIKYLLVMLVVLTAVSAFAQTRDDTCIYIAPVVASPDQAVYFMDNFTMETIGAGYNVTDDPGEADYTLMLEVKPNMILYDDGTEEQAPEDEPQFILQIILLDQENTEMVAFSFPFTEVDEMYGYNLQLVYQAMANVPMTKLVGVEIVPETDTWRNKWIYFRAAFSYPIVTYQLIPDPVWGNAIGNPNRFDNEGHPVISELNHKVSAIPGASVGLEFQFLDWMSAEIVFDMTFGDPNGFSFIPGLAVELKFPLKPAKYFMLEPYIAFAASLNTSNNYRYYPFYAIGGGFQLGVKGGDMGAFVFDVNFLYSLGQLVMNNPKPKDYPKPEFINYNVWKIGLSVGYKIGFIDRIR